MKDLIYFFCFCYIVFKVVAVGVLGNATSLFYGDNFNMIEWNKTITFICIFVSVVCCMNKGGCK
jgi:hypothetical protein